MKTQFGVDAIFEAAVRRLAFIGIAALIVMFVAQFYVLSLQSHRAACEIVSARLNQFVGPLSRELAVGDIAVATSMFDDFKKVVSVAGSESSLVMTLSAAEPPRPEEVCVASALGSKVSAPISFAGKKLAVIEGKIFYFPTITLFIFVIAVLIALLLGLRIWALGVIRLTRTLVLDPIKEISMGRVILSPAEKPAEVLLISKNVESLKRRLIEEEKISSELAHNQQLGEIALQLAHDIRSPLSVLAILSQEGVQFDRDARGLMIQASKRIQSISQGLMQKYRPRESELVPTRKESEPVLRTLEKILNEKRAVERFRSAEFDIQNSPGSEFMHTNVDEDDLGRVFSNLIDNAFESYESKGHAKKTILITISTQNGNLKVLFQDSGAGIDEKVLPKLTERGVSFKANGNGLGLYHARKVCEQAGGSLLIESELGKGTTVELILPLSEMS